MDNTSIEPMLEEASNRAVELGHDINPAHWTTGERGCSNVCLNCGRIIGVTNTRVLWGTALNGPCPDKKDESRERKSASQLEDTNARVASHSTTPIALNGWAISSRNGDLPGMTLPVIPGTVQSQPKPKSKILWIVAGLVLLFIFMTTLGKWSADNLRIDGGREHAGIPAIANSGQSAEQAQFNSLKPSEHLSQAMMALRPGATPEQIEEGIRHLRAIPQSAPQAGQAKSLMTKLIRAQHLAKAQLLIDSAPVDDLNANLESLRKANDELQAVFQQNPHDKDAVRLLNAATNKGLEALDNRQPELAAILRDPSKLKQIREQWIENAQKELWHQGFEITLRTHGTTLQVEYALAGNAFAYQFGETFMKANRDDLKMVGFKRVELSNGITVWSWKLE